MKNTPVSDFVCMHPTCAFAVDFYVKYIFVSGEI